MKNFAFILLLFLIGSNLNAQRLLLNIDNYNRTIGGPNALERIDEQYFDGNFSSAILSNENTGYVYQLRYNAFYDEIELENEGKRYYLNKTIGEEIYFRELNKIYVAVNYFYNKKYITGFLVEVYKGDKFTAYKREKIEHFIGNKSDEVRSTGSKQYREVKDVYFIKMGESITEIPASKKKFAVMFGDKEADVSKFLKDKNISLTNYMDLRELFKYLNTL